MEQRRRVILANLGTTLRDTIAFLFSFRFVAFDNPNMCEVSICAVSISSTVCARFILFISTFLAFLTESRIKTSAEREFYARNLIRKELIEKAMNNDIEGIKVILEEVAAECEASSRDGRYTLELLCIVNIHVYIGARMWGTWILNFLHSENLHESSRILMCRSGSPFYTIVLCTKGIFYIYVYLCS